MLQEGWRFEYEGLFLAGKLIFLGRISRLRVRERIERVRVVMRIMCWEKNERKDDGRCEWETMGITFYFWWSS